MAAEARARCSICPLARALHASIDLDETVPVEHYKAVAEVIGFVLRTRRRRA